MNTQMVIKNKITLRCGLDQYSRMLKEKFQPLAILVIQNRSFGFFKKMTPLCTEIIHASSLFKMYSPPPASGLNSEWLSSESE